MKKIIINAKEYEVGTDEISYEEIVGLCGKKTNVLYTVTFYHHTSIVGVGGSLTPGKKTKVYPGMVINCVYTGSA